MKACLLQETLYRRQYKTLHVVSRKKMDTIYIFLIFFYGQLWRSVSMETQMPPKILSSTIFLKQSRNRSIHLGEEKGNPAPKLLYQSNELGNSYKTAKKASSATMTTHATAAEESAHSDGSWIAAMLIGIILTSMIIVSIIILLWKCSKNPAVVDPNWAGRSPFADGDMPEVTEGGIKDMEQTTKRASVLSILPWKFNRSSLLRDNVEGSKFKERPETSSSCNTKEEGSQSTPKLKGGSAPFAANILVSSSITTNVTPPAVSDGPSNVCNPPLNPILPPPESSDLPPPPDWLNEVQENQCPEISESPEFKSDAQSQFPLPPDLTNQDVNLPLPLPPTLPQ